MAKGAAEKIRLESTGTREDGTATGYRRWTKVSKHAESKLEKMAYDPRAWHAENKKYGAHVLFVQKKMPPSKKN